MREPAHPTELPVSFLLKRGTLFGAGLGMLAGLVYLAMTGTDSNGTTAGIVLWRNLILIGAGAGFIVGAIVAWWLRSLSGEHSEMDTENDREHTPDERISNTSDSKP